MHSTYPSHRVIVVVALEPLMGLESVERMERVTHLERTSWLLPVSHLNGHTAHFPGCLATPRSCSHQDSQIPAPSTAGGVLLQQGWIQPGTGAAVPPARGIKTAMPRPSSYLWGRQTADRSGHRLWWQLPGHPHSKLPRPGAYGARKTWGDA